eukprot:jgi/Psemu1/46293/gm1.46293_g
MDVCFPALLEDETRKLANEMMQWWYNDAKNGVPGGTYYMTPLTVPILGHVDCSITRGRLDAYIYHEGIDGKGGDNVASLIMMNLRQKGYLKDTSCGAELNIVMDNCQGQNKNNMVIHLALLLVEVRYFKKLATALETHGQISVTEVKDGNSKKIDAFLNVFYKKIQKGAVQPGHIFTVKQSCPSTMIIWQDRLGTEDDQVQNLVKKTPLPDHS